MGLRQSDADDALVRITVQFTRAQARWLADEGRRRQVRSVPAVLRQIVQAEIDASAVEERAS
jgi:hypothetical protein